MEQLTQKLKSGEMVIQELPMPYVQAGTVLVRNHYSLISAGTESSTVKTARKSLIGKAKERPQQVKLVFDTLKKQGPVQTYRAVMKKLDAYTPLGYSCAGEIVAIGAGINGFAIGDLVACGGLTASHGEVVAVPVNLCVKLAKDADMKLASYNTLGAIALQGIRQADLRLGESCVVIGLGLLGQLTCLMLKAGGIKTFGIDVDDAAVNTAKTYCTSNAWNRTEPGIEIAIDSATGGLGADAVIITAGTSSLDPINLAGTIARKKGTVVVVGAVPTGFDRDPHWYKKELQLKMSCSYGPGRYDLDYEEKGCDYPAAYVRWTENRNMQAFQDMVHSRAIDISYLTSHEVSLDNAPQAYDMIISQSEPFLGVVIKYDISKPLQSEKITVGKSVPAGRVNLAFIGAGSYAQGNLLPNIPRNDKDITCKGVLTNSGTTSKRVAEKFGFEFCTSNIDDILNCDEINTIFITTRHDSHAHYLQQALNKKKHVFVEKPICLTSQELTEIHELYNSLVIRPQIMVGYNRRFAPLAVEMKKRSGGGAMSMIYRINAGSIPAESWIQDVEIGGGRIIGEVCHFVDFLTWFCGSLPVSVHANALADPYNHNDTVAINISFANGSIGTLCYFANGSKTLAKEYVEIYTNGTTSVLTDFSKLEIFGKGKPLRKKILNQNKGQGQMVSEFLDGIKTGKSALISPQEIFTVAKACFAIIESIQTRQVVNI